MLQELHGCDRLLLDELRIGACRMAREGRTAEIWGLCAAAREIQHKLPLKHTVPGDTDSWGVALGSYITAGNITNNERTIVLTFFYGTYSSF